MHYSTIFATLALATLSCAASVPQAKVLSLPVTKGYRPGVIDTKAKRDNTPLLPLANQLTYYQATLKIGNPPVEVHVDIDTGSSDLWVGNSNYKTTDSSTWTDSGHEFSIEYVDKSSAEGSLGTDDVTFAGVTVKAGEFAAVDGAGPPQGGDGIFGIGYSLEDTNAEGYTYKNLPALLKDQGFIETLSFSLWANDYAAGGDGSVLFGGVDHARYEGTLSKVPIIIPPEATGHGTYGYPSGHMRLSTILNGISLKNSAGEKADVVTGAALPVTLDSGASLSLLPPDFVKAVGESLGFTLQEGNEQSPNSIYYTTVIPEGSITFNLSGVEIEIPLKQFLMQLIGTDGQKVFVLGSSYFYNQEGVDFNSYTTFLLGDPFLSGAYVAYDLDNNEIGLANAKVGDISDSDVEAIGSSGIPGTAAPNYSSTDVNTEYSTQIATIF